MKAVTPCVPDSGLPGLRWRSRTNSKGKTSGVWVVCLSTEVSDELVSVVKSYSAEHTQREPRSAFIDIDQQICSTFENLRSIH